MLAIDRKPIGAAIRKKLRERCARVIVTRAFVPLLIFAAYLSVASPAWAGENLLVRIAWQDPSVLISAERSGGVVRYCQSGLAILEMGVSDLETLRSAGVSFDVIDSTRAGRRHWLLTPAEPSSVDSLAAYGRLTLLDGRSLYLIGLDEILEPRLAPFVFSLTLLPDSMDWRRLLRTGMPPQLPRGIGARALTGAAETGFLGAVSSAVSVDSMRATVHFLSFDDDSGKFRSRFTFRTDSLFFAEWLRERLEATLGSRGTASLDSFVFRYGGEPFTRYNVVGRVPGRVPGSGTLVVCAHYDSQGNRTVYTEPGRTWHWQTDPAPGADDNGSGVASVLECARALSGLEFDFDLEFVLFCAEEQGLLGSGAYVEERKVQGENILGALNFDMHAFRAASDTTFVRTNLSSDWLSNHIKAVSEAAFDSIGLRVGLVPVEGPYDASDHSSFWRNGFDGVHFFEQAGFPVINPYYHTIGDTSGTLNYELAWKVAKLGAASVAYFSTTSRPWDLEVLAGDLKIGLAGATGSIGEGSVGQILSINPSFHNMGASVPDTVSVHVSVYDGEPSTGWLIGERVISVAATPIPPGGSPVISPFSWVLTESDVGAHSIYLVVDAGDSEQNRANNAVSRTLRVASQSLAITRSFVFPNPSDVPLSDVRLRVFVTRDAELTEVDVYDVSGRRIGGCRNGECGSSALLPGDNDVALRSALSGSRISPGVYLYRVCVSDGVQKKVCYGRFAIIKQ